MLVGLWVTTACNLRCTYCYEGLEKSQEFMSLEVADKAVEFILEKQQELNDETIVVQFHGGEPLLNEDAIRYVVNQLENKSRNKSIRVMFGVTTNGLLLNEKNSQFYEENMEYDFSISIDGTKYNHDRYRKTFAGKGTYDTLIHNLNKYIDLDRKNIRARMTFNSETVSELAKNIEHIADLGFRIIVSIPDYFDTGWNDQKMELFFDELKKLRKWYQERRDDTLFISLLDKTFRRKGVCGGGIDNFHILPKGDIYPCSYGAGSGLLKIGNLFDKQKLDKNKILKLHSISEELNPSCEGCTNMPYCISSRCKIINKLTMGDYLLPNPVICNVENIKYQYCNYCDS